ncbi:hypothetical protein [Leucobacter salsicius]|uniref:hypothetical protein n=1 Tax=Leucobacter salsicius TaxID=664638 RepID=UPI00034B4863|nr:hypothetical protein [Leucobacter salsicius]
MQPPDVMFLEVMLVALAMILFGATIAGVGFLLWVGIVLTVGIGAWWVVSRYRRHGTHY